MWVQQDLFAGVVGRSASLNRYTYVEGAPETFVDVLGFYRSADAFDAYMATLDGSVGKPWTTSALEFVDNHQGDIIGGLVTVGCTVVTGGAGVLGCVALGSTISGSLNYYADTPAEDRSVSGLLTAVSDRVAFDVVVTVATLGLAAVAAPIVGAVVRTVAAPIRSGVTTAIRSVSQKITTAATVTRNATAAVGNTVRTGAQSVSNAGRTAVQRVTNVVDDRVAAVRLNPDAGHINLGAFVKPGVDRGASVGQTFSANYRATFFAANPGLEGKVVVHHAVEQQVLKRYPGLFAEEYIHSLANLRGIPVGSNSSLHLSQIRRSWNNFYRSNSTPTRADVLKHADEVDGLFASQFVPPIG